jgi:cytochrome c oxidase cbb3-type subunit I/II
MRFLGGLFYISGAILMVVNVIKTVRAGSFQKKFLQKLLHWQTSELQEKKEKESTYGWKELLLIAILAFIT